MIFSIKGEGKQYTTKKDVENIVNEMNRKSEDIVELDFTDNTFKLEAMKAVVEVIQKMDNLQIIIFDSLFTTLNSKELKEELTMLSKALMGKKLKAIDISNNALSCEFPDKFAELLESLDTLKFLTISNCGLGSQGGERIGRCLNKSKCKDVIQVLDMTQNMLACISDVLADDIASLGNLSALIIGHNSIEKRSMTNFLKKMQNNSLAVLDITDNILNEEGCSALGDIFATWNVRDIKMGDCLAKTEGMMRFLEAANKKLVSMNLPGQYEEFGDIVLDISYNDLEQDCAQDLAKFCKKYSISTLYITGNMIDDVEELKTACESYGGVLVLDEDLIGSSESEHLLEDEVVERIGKL